MFGRMHIKSAQFITSAHALADCPTWDRPEVALIGRSNVGKSSLINLLAGNDSLAKVSGTPGKTRLLNFFLMNGWWSLVDLPGYGYAKAARSETFAFNERVGDYLEQRENLRRVFVLIDARLPPQRLDVDFTQWLVGTGMTIALIFTKVDKQSAAKTRANMALFQERLWGPLPAAVPVMLCSSVKTGAGRAEILRDIEQTLLP